MSNVQTARDLVAHQDYAVTGGNGATALTRKSCEHQEWVFGATGGHEFMSKCDKNVFKKHRRKNYRRTRGHRQGFTQLRVTGIETK